MGNECNSASVNLLMCTVHALSGIGIINKPQSLSLQRYLLLLSISRSNCANTMLLRQVKIIQFHFSVAAGSKKVRFLGLKSSSRVASTIYYYLTTVKACRCLFPIHSMPVKRAAISKQNAFLCFFCFRVSCSARLLPTFWVCMYHAYQ